MNIFPYDQKSLFEKILHRRRRSERFSLFPFPRKKIQSHLGTRSKNQSDKSENIPGHLSLNFDGKKSRKSGDF